jgi:peptidoglycan/LPS O-acetylase OafA/YrhL
LADRWRSRPADPNLPVTLADVWKWRLYAWAASSFCLVLNYHSPVSYAWTLNLFALVAYGWIVQEITTAQAGRSFSVHLERWGRWSYSLYLCHMPANSVYLLLGLGAYLASAAQWTVGMLFILVASYAFHVAIEYPSHLAARRLSNAALRSGR